jgi:aerobic carbon-monoxide dehydrogenase small subunit
MITVLLDSGECLFVEPDSDSSDGGRTGSNRTRTTVLPGLSRLRTEHPNRRRFGGGRTHGEEKSAGGRVEVRRARTGDGRNARETTVIGIPGVENIDKALTAADISPPPLGIDKDVISVAAKIDLLDALTIRNREGAKPGRGRECDDDTSRSLIERHGKIPAGAPHGPRRGLLPGEAVNHHDRRRLRDVDEYPAGAVVELEAFQVSGDSEFCDLPPLQKIDRGDGAVAVSDQQALARRIDSDVVGIVAQFDAPLLSEVAGEVPPSLAGWARTTANRSKCGGRVCYSWPPQTNSAQSGIRAACAGRQGELSDRRCMTTAATRTISFTLNGEPVSAAIATHHTLLEVVRDTFSLYGARESCGQGLCGCCTLIVDGRAVSGCLYLAAFADGTRVETIESLDQDGTLDPVQEAFIEHGAFQCGFCTPGFVLMVKQLLDEYPDPDLDRIRDYLAGNLCRCAAYPEIIQAVKAAARKRQAGRSG